MGKEPRFTNRLVKEKSPYLLQHAHNPVDWYPWGNEAFEAARLQDKPIFLSIGYATCHWCHTMEKESFENAKLAELMNEVFINVKVDREELPEIDSIYMDFAQSMMSGSAGWPLNVLLTPNLKPFFATTYLPPQNHQGMMGLKELVERIREIWKGEEREKVEFQAEKIVDLFSTNSKFLGSELPSKSLVAQCGEILFKIADPIFGGLKGAPKFPVGYQYSFLLSYAATENDSRSLFLVERTLDMMHRGGIYDHLGGGISRYSVDERWTIPHFEKMLYDNALLADAYINAWRYTKKDLYKDVAIDILNYVLRDMTHPEGGFFSAEDADSEGEEGQFYTWSYQEVIQLLGAEKGKRFADFYSVTKEGNFKNSLGEETNVLHYTLPVEEFALKHKIDPLLLSQELREGRRILFEARKKRIHPSKDDKVLTSWNGLMIHSFIEVGSAFKEQKFIDAALACVNFIRTYLWDRKDLYRRWREGEALYTGSLDDYAYLIRALIKLFEQGYGTDYLAWAIELTNILEKDFKLEGGAYFQSNGQDDSLIIRKIHLTDGAEPSGNSVHCENLLHLYEITKDPKYLASAEDIFKSVKKLLDSYSPGYFYHVMNLSRYYDKNRSTFVIVLDKKNNFKEELRNSLNEKYSPHRSVIWVEKNDKKILELLPVLKDFPIKEEKTTLYHCTQEKCDEPVTDFATMIQMISEK